jgi:hypothetical protein
MMEKQRFLFWIGTFERQQQVQGVKIQIGEMHVHDEIVHIDIISNGEIIMDLIQILHQRYDDR